MLWWWLRQLRSTDREAFLSAAQKLGGMKERRAVDPLIEALANTNAWFREAALKALGEIGDPRAIDAVRQHLTDEDSLVKEAATTALAKIEGHEAPVEPSPSPPIASPTEPIVPAASSSEGAPAATLEPIAEQSSTRSNGAEPAAETAPKPAPTPPKTPMDPTTARMRSITASLRAVKTVAPPAPRRSKALDALDEIVTAGTAETAIPIRPAAAADKLHDARAIPVVAMLLDDPDREARRAAVNTLSRIAVPEVIPLLVKTLADVDITVVTTASQALVAFGRAAIDPLKTLVHDKRDRVRYAAIQTLSRIDRHWAEKDRALAAKPPESPAVTDAPTASPLPEPVPETPAPAEPQPVADAPTAAPLAEPIATAEAAPPPEPITTAEATPPAEPIATADTAPTPEPIATAEAATPPEPIATAEAATPPEPIATAAEEPHRVPAREVIAALVHPDSEVRAAAAKLLNRLYPGWSRTETARAAIPDLVVALRSGDPDLKPVAASVLSSIDDPTATAALREGEGERHTEP